MPAVADRCGRNCWPEFVDGGAVGLREPAVCAIATEVLTRASNAIVVINFRLMGGTPLTINGNGKPDH